MLIPYGLSNFKLIRDEHYFYIDKTHFVPALNVRTDYGKLQQLARIVGAGGETHREILEQVLSDGSVSSGLTEQFGVQGLSGKQEFISLLYYFGLLTIGPQSAESRRLRLEVPNRVIRELLIGLTHTCFS